MRKRQLNRRDFIQQAAGAVGAAWATSTIQLSPQRARRYVPTGGQRRSGVEVECVVRAKRSVVGGQVVASRSTTSGSSLT